MMQGGVIDGSLHRSTADSGGGPVPTKPKHGRHGASDREGVLSTAGSWKDLVDADALKAQLASERGSSRSPADL